MNNEKKIEFYKRRSVGEVLSAGADFIRQNGKVLFKNAFIIGGPLACLHGYFMHKYTVASKYESLMLSGGDLSSFYFNLVFYLITAMALSLFLYSITTAIISSYGEDKLTPHAGWNDLKGNLFLHVKRILVVSLLVIVAVVLFALVVGAIYGGLGTFSTAAAFGFLLVIIGFVVVFSPGLSLLVYPAIFHQQSAGSSIATAFSLGFRYWGSTFLVLLVSGIVMAVFSYLVAGLYEIWMVFGLKILPMGVVFEIISYILAIIASLASVVATPVLVTFLAFQYFNIVEQEEGVSVQSEMDEFDNL